MIERLWELWLELREYLGENFDLFRDTADILIVTLGIYWLLLLIRGTRAVQILLGLIIFGVGLYLANLAAAAIKASGMAQAGMLALVARVAVIVLTGAMALGQMGLANEIINLAFGLMLGSIAVAAALAFGLGGRELAATRLKQWLETK